ncbi:inactive pancreatic lipase-related protein 1 [Sergentomyia squamirostris]
MPLKIVIFLLCAIRVLGQDYIYLTTPSSFNDATNTVRTTIDEPNILESILNFNLREKVNFFLYRRKNRNKAHPILFPKERSDNQSAYENLDLSPFNPELQTKLLVHGWRSNEESDTVQNIKNNYLSKKNVNIITVDYRDIAANNFYFAPAFQIRQVGKYIAELIDYLVTFRNANTSDFHIIGHSLGSHLAGYIGAFTTTGKVGRISGLDPAILGFEWSGPDSRLDPSDAQFVDVIHTAAGSCGFRDPIGHVDFYPNGGIVQPGCGNNILDQLACSHGRAHHLFAESILTSLFYSYPGSSWAAFVRGEYNRTDMIKMGDPAPSNSRGLYFLQTNPQRPFAMGPFFGTFGFIWDTFNLLNG